LGRRKKYNEKKEIIFKEKKIKREKKERLIQLINIFLPIHKKITNTTKESI